MGVILFTTLSFKIQKQKYNPSKSMAPKTQTATIVPPSYIDFEPYCECQKGDQVESLVFHLPDFKKDQLRVQVNNLGVMKVSGEGPVNRDGAKKRRFIKETKLPQGCDVNGIRAKFSNDHLHVTMPKKATPQVQLQKQNPEQKQEQEQEQEQEALLPPKDEKLAPTSSKIGASSHVDQPKDDDMFGLGNTLARLQVQKKMNVGLGVAVAAIVAIGAYVAFNYGSSSSSPPSPAED